MMLFLCLKIFIFFVYFVYSLVGNCHMTVTELTISQRYSSSYKTSIRTRASTFKEISLFIRKIRNFESVKEILKQIDQSRILGIRRKLSEKQNEFKKVGEKVKLFPFINLFSFINVLSISFLISVKF